MRFLALILVLLGLAVPLKASAVPPADPPLTYELTVYDRDPSRLAPDGTRVIALAMPPHATACAEGEVKGGVAVIKIEVTQLCPAGMTVYFALMNLPGGGITAFADPPIEWRAAYSESASIQTSTVRPFPPPTSVSTDATPLVCPPNLPPIGPARTERFGKAEFDMPAGAYRWFESPQGSGRIVVCGPTYAAMSFSSETCAPLLSSAFPGDELRKVLASCRVIA